MTTDRLLGELARQDKYLERLPDDFEFPLFNAKTAVESQRQNGYRSTASAVRELVDNALEGGANRAVNHRLDCRRWRMNGHPDFHRRTIPLNRVYLRVMKVCQGDLPPLIRHA